MNNIPLDFLSPMQRKIVGILLTLVALLLLPHLLAHGAGNTWVRTLDFALLYIMLALGLNIVVGYAGLLDLGYIAFYGLGAYVYALLSSPHLAYAFPQFFHATLAWSPWVILPLGGLIAGIFGLILGAPTLKLRGDYLAIVTLGFGEIINICLKNLYRPPLNLTNGPQGISPISSIESFGFSLGKPLTLFGYRMNDAFLHYYLFIVLLALIIVISMRLEKSRIGRAWMAIREDEIAAKSIGIHTTRIKLLAFAMGASFGGVAGGLFASIQGTVSPDSFNLMESVIILCMVVMGGMGRIAGVILGAILLTAAPELLRVLVDWQAAYFGKNALAIDASTLRMLLFGIGLVAIMRFRPAGLLPSSIHKRELDQHVKEGENV